MANGEAQGQPRGERGPRREGENNRPRGPRPEGNRGPRPEGDNRPNFRKDDRNKKNDRNEGGFKGERKPREERPVKFDPDSPFAKLAALRDQLKK